MENNYELYKGVYYKLLFNDKKVPIWKLTDVDDESGYATIYSAWEWSLKDAHKQFVDFVIPDKAYGKQLSGKI